jgi:8-oxo-dGTP pyrophosphatase MutT (NUDIX family)
MVKEVAIAILHQNDRYLMQLRDDIPTIVYPGQWTFFGGTVEPGEPAEVAVMRELQEEIRYQPPYVELFRREHYRDFIRNVFHAPLTVDIQDLELCEGLDLDLWTAEQVHQGKKFSPKAGEVRKIGKPHQRVLIDYIEGNREQGIGNRE